jgi:hypothetical protein
MDKNKEMISKECYTKEDAYQTLLMINSWTSNIDTKISFVMAFMAILIGFVFSADEPRVFSERLNTYISGILAVFGKVLDLQVLGCLLVLCLYVACALSVIFLSLALCARIKNKSGVTSIFFFGDIASRKFDEVKNDMEHISEEKMVLDLQNQIYNNSEICKRKVNLYNKGLLCFVVSMILYFIIEIL